MDTLPLDKFGQAFLAIFVFAFVVHVTTREVRQAGLWFVVKCSLGTAALACALGFALYAIGPAGAVDADLADWHGGW